MDNIIFLKSLLDEYVNEVRDKKKPKDIDVIERALEIISIDALEDKFAVNNQCCVTERDKNGL